MFYVWNMQPKLWVQNVYVKKPWEIAGGCRFCGACWVLSTISNYHVCAWMPTKKSKYRKETKVQPNKDY